MTIFDTIRYPISEYPTQREIEALPKEIVADWCVLQGRVKPPYVLMSFWKIVHNNDVCNEFDEKFKITELRKLIENYEFI